jgi:ribosomal-protein-alanine N-acetyltransferase
LKAAVLARLHAEAFAHARPWSEAEFTALLQQPGVIACGDAACFVLGRVTLDEAEILTLATSPAFRRQGLAAKATAQFELAIIEAGARSVFLEVAADNVPARSLYASLGFGQVGRRRAYYPRAGHPPADALILRKQLAAR